MERWPQADGSSRLRVTPGTAVPGPAEPTCPPAAQQGSRLLRRAPPAEPLLQRRVPVALGEAELGHGRPPQEIAPVDARLGALLHQLQPR